MQISSLVVIHGGKPCNIPPYGTLLYYPQISLHMTYHNLTFNLQELPYVHIPLNTSMCDNNHTHHNHTHHTSLIDTCDVTPELAREANAVTPGTLSCTSSIVPNCNTISCVVQPSGERLEVTFLPCGKPPAVHVAVSSGVVNATTVTPLSMNLTDPHNVVLASIGGSQVPLYVDITQHRSNLSLGVEVCWGGGLAGFSPTPSFLKSTNFLSQVWPMYATVQYYKSGKTLILSEKASLRYY